MQRLALLSIVALGVVTLPSPAWSQDTSSPLERYRKLEFPAKEDNFEKGWKERTILDFEIISSADLAALRAALKDRDPLVRAIAARALGIRGDKESADALADLVSAEPEYMVRIRAVESLAYLKMKPEAIELAKKDKSLGVQWSANLAARQLKSDQDYAAQVRQAYATPLAREAIGSAT